MTRKRYGNDGTTAVKTVCAIVFCLFTFIYLYCYQGSVLAVAQNHLSHGATRYDHLVGALLITFVAWLVQRGVQFVMRLSDRLYAFGFFPSVLLLTMLCDYRSSDVASHYLRVWTWLAPLSFLAWWGLLSMLRQAEEYDSRVLPASLFSRSMWVSLLLLGLQFLFLGGMTGGDDNFHYRARIEAELMKGRVEEAARVGKRSMVSSPSLTMLRAYTLSLQGRLGDELFRYPVSNGSDALLPTNAHASCLLLPADSIYHHLGGKPAHEMTVLTYLKLLRRTGHASKAAADYELCAHLLNRNLQSFVRLLPRYYAINDSLPRHYREALVLYVHQTSSPLIVYHENAIDTDYDDLQKLERTYPDATARSLAVYKQYFGTYWWYYFYAGKTGRP